jgi:NRPS condensation-like uncharacterized protein
MNIENLHDNLPKRIHAEISDRIQFFLRSNADQQMRFIIYLSQNIDIDVLRKAFRLTIYTEPIFSYTYKEEKNQVYWQKQEVIDSTALIDLIDNVSDVAAEVNHFLKLTISPFEFPIVKARIIRDRNKDVLCINMNHTPTDGAGLKEFVKILASNYSKLITDPDYTNTANIKGDRSIKQVTKSFTFKQKIQFIKQGFNKPKRAPSWSFNWNKSVDDKQYQFVTTKITSEIFDNIKTFGKLNNATINDLILAAFIRVFVTANHDNLTAAKPIIVPVDLRKFIKPGHKAAICSLTGSLICNIGVDIGPTFKDTLKKVCKEMKYKKEVHAEMHMLAQQLVLSRFVPYAKLKEQIMHHKMPPIPLVTNVGIINSSDINFGGIPLEYSYITGAVCYGDYFCMGYSTFNKEITFSIGFTGGDLQIQKVKAFLDRLRAELENIS